MVQEKKKKGILFSSSTRHVQQSEIGFLLKKSADKKNKTSTIRKL